MLPHPILRDRRIVACAALLLLALTAPAVAQEAVFWNRDGSGSFPDAKPPPAFDGEAGTGVRWKAPLLNWSNSSPLVVQSAAGPRVVLLAEPIDYAPFLLCFDADSGAELWRRELDAVAAFPVAQQAGARSLARRGWAASRLRKRLTTEIQALYLADKEAWKDRDHPPAAAAALLAEVKAAGLQFRGIRTGAGGYAEHLEPVRGGSFDQDHRQLTELGLMWSIWDYAGTWDGVAYPTPISDGARIWTVTSHNLYSCHDIAGKLLWQVRFPPAGPHELDEKQKVWFTSKDGGVRWNRGWPGQGGFSTAPLMVDGKLISAAGHHLRCLDAATGTLLWDVISRGDIGQALGVPGVATVGDHHYVIAVGSEKRYGEGDAIYRLSDGTFVGYLPGSTASKSGVSGPVVWGDLVINKPPGDGPVACHRLVANGEAIVPELVWSLTKSAKREESISLFRPAWQNGRLYHGGTVLDLATGAWVSTRRNPIGQGYFGQGCILIGPALLHWNFYGDGTSKEKGVAPRTAGFVWTDAGSGAVIATGSVPINPADGKPLDFKREQACLDHWRWLGAATPFAWKNRLYVRAYDFLWCLGGT